MNIDTGELIRANKERLQELKKQGFTEVPEALQQYANKELGDKEEVIVDMSKNTKLTQWAKSVKRRKKRKVKNKMAKRSRKINRK